MVTIGFYFHSPSIASRRCRGLSTTAPFLFSHYHPCAYWQLGTSLGTVDIELLVYEMTRITTLIFALCLLGLYYSCSTLSNAHVLIVHLILGLALCLTSLGRRF